MATKDFSRLNIMDNLPEGISFEDDIILLEQFQKYGDKDAWQKLVNGNLRLVRRFVRNLAPIYLHCQGPAYPDMDDLFSEGVMALFTCINYYDLDAKKFRFSTYLANAIKRRFKVIKLYDKGNSENARLNAPAYDDNDDTEQLDMLPDETISVEGLHENMEIKFILSDILPILSKEEREIFIGVAIDGKDFQQVGDERNFTREGVRVKYNKILSKVQRIYFEGASEEDLLTRGVKIKDSMREQVKINADLIKTYGRKFLLREVIPTLKSATQRKLATIGILRYAGQNYSEMFRECGVYDQYATYITFLKTGFKSYVEAFVKAEQDAKLGKALQEKLKQSSSKKNSTKYQKLIEDKGGEMLLRRFFLPKLEPKMRQAFEACVLEYEGGSVTAQIKKSGITTTNSAVYGALDRAFGKLDKFNPAEFEGQVTAEQRKQEKIAQTLINQFGRDALAEYFNGQKADQRAFLIRSVLKYDGSNLDMIAADCNLNAQDAKELLNNVALALTASEQVEQQLKVAKEPTKAERAKVETVKKMPREQRQRMNKYAKLVQDYGGELFLRKYFLPTLPERERKVFEGAVLEYEGETMGEIASSLDLSPQSLSTCLAKVMKKLENADFEALIARIDGDEQAYIKMDEQSITRRKKLVEEYGFVKLKELFLPVLPSTQKKIFETLYLSKSFPTVAETARKLDITPAVVSRAENVVIEKLKSTDFVALAKIREEAREYLKSLKDRKAERQASPTQKRNNVADEYGGREFLAAHAKELFHVPIDRIIFEHYVIDGEDFDTVAKIIKPIQGKETKSYCTGKWAGYIKPKLQKFKESFEDFDKAVEEFYAQRSFEKQHSEQSMEEQAFGSAPARKTRGQASKGFSSEDMERYGGAAHIILDVLPTLKLSNQVVLLALIKGQSMTEITESTGLSISAYQTAKRSILATLSGQNGNDDAQNAADADDDQED